MADPFYIVDGSGYIFRAYYGVQPLKSSDGFPTNALFGFSKMLVKLLKDLKARHIAVTFDTGQPTFRHELYVDYKANRSECPEDLVPQMPYFRSIVKAMGISSLEKAGFEADDIIATLTEKFQVKGHEIVIVSGDKDLTQLVNERVTVWDGMRDITYTPEKVQDKFGVKPSQIRDYLALRGDSSDNIPGVKGVGDKTAQALIKHFGSIEALTKNISSISEIEGLRGKASVEKKIGAGLELLELSYRLVGLDCEVSPFWEQNNLETYLWQKPDLGALAELFSKFEFTNLLNEVKGLNGGLALILSEEEPREDDTSVQGKQFKLVGSENFSEFLSLLSEVEEFAFDTETTSLRFHEAKLLGISFSWEKGVAWYLPIESELDSGLTLNLDLVREKLNPIFANPDILKVGQHLKYDLNILLMHGFEVNGLIFDSMLASYLLEPDSRQHGLKFLCKRYLGEEMREYKEVLGDRESLAQVPLKEVCDYACHDAEASWNLYRLLEEKLHQAEVGEDSLSPDLPEQGGSLTDFLARIELPLIPVLSGMEISGIRIDRDFLSKLREEFGAELLRLEAKIKEQAGLEFNLNSPKQLAKVLFEDLGISTVGVKKTKSGFSTDASVLAKLSSEHPIVPDILQYRELYKLSSTYIESLLKLADSKTDRIHSSFNQAITATGRLSSSDPNLQNIPIRTEQGRRLRSAFIAADGCQLISADYSQIELRILAELSGDRNLQQAFISGEDIHLSTAKDIFGAQMMSESELKSFRRVAKTINFGIIYGISAFRLAKQLGVSRRQAQDYINNYFSRYPGVKKYFDTLARTAEEKGYAETMFGRRRFLAQIETTGRDKGYARRSILNAPIQGTAAEVIKLAMINLDRQLKKYSDKARLVLQVHDELVVEAETPFLEEVSQLVVSEMENAVQLSIPLRVDLRQGKSWG